MNWQNIKYTLYSLLLFIPQISLPISKPSPLQFESSEHVSAGSQVMLYFTAKDLGKMNMELLMPNGLKLTYGQLVSLGDFYGVVARPISAGVSDVDRRSRFVGAFDSFARYDDALVEMPKIMVIVQAEKNAIDEGMKLGEKPEDIYTRISDENNRQWNCVTGGGCDAKTWVLKPGRYLDLAKQDVDHFGENAWLAYQAGHKMALQTAIEAHQTQDIQTLTLAYAMNGFACHFLSDRFSSGHIRSPRVELPANVTPSVVGSLLVHFMHDEEDAYGLHMHNLRGNHWLAYGDRYYYDKVNNVNVDLLHDALQTSSDEIFSAYQNGTLPTNDEVAQLIPIPDEIADKGTLDIAPLFYWDPTSHKLFRRTDTTNPEDRHWTANWWGWSTLILLAHQHGLPASSQAQLVKEGYGARAIEAGLITDETLLAYAKKP